MLGVKTVGAAKVCNTQSQTVHAQSSAGIQPVCTCWLIVASCMSAMVTRKPCLSFSEQTVSLAPLITPAVFPFFFSFLFLCLPAVLWPRRPGVQALLWHRPGQCQGAAAQARGDPAGAEDADRDTEARWVACVCLQLGAANAKLGYNLTHNKVHDC